jgi:hypothetical protein
MPSQQYFEELTRAVLTDVDQVNSFPSTKVLSNSNS